MTTDWNHCGRKDCVCTHTGGCDRGFINLVELRPDGSERDLGVSPCRTCRQELSDIVETSWSNEERQRRIGLMRERERVQKVATRSS